MLMARYPHPHSSHLAQEAATCFADIRKNLAGYPVLELASLGFVRAHDGLVETAFGYDESDA
jgi:hypothetical protein